MARAPPRRRRAARRATNRDVREWVDCAVAKGLLKEWKGITMEIVD